jgi:hypothetical protein
MLSQCHSPSFNPVFAGEAAEDLLSPLQDLVVGVFEGVGVDAEGAGGNGVEGKALGPRL